MPPVIFITAYDEYAVKASELNAVDYLLKPFDEERLHESIDRARQRIAATTQECSRSDWKPLLTHKRPKRAESWFRNGDRIRNCLHRKHRLIESREQLRRTHCGPKHYLLGETLTGWKGRLDSAQVHANPRGRIVTSRILAVLR